MVIVQSVWCTFQEIFLYPWMVAKLNIPLPLMAGVGMLIVGFCYIWCGAATSEFSAMAAFTVLWFGWCSSAPTSVSIISVCLCGMYEG